VNWEYLNKEEAVKTFSSNTKIERDDALRAK
jgi:hypothetical protein